MRSEPGRLKYLEYLLGLSLGLVGLIGFSLVFYVQLLWAVEDQNGRPEKTWQTLAELSEGERMPRSIWPQETPRDATVPYLPAEAYPFRAPYTAEEMGFRAMEFPHMPRWNCVQVEDMGLLTPSGSLSSSQILVLVHYRKPEGLMGHLTAQPGELLAHWLTQDLSPPENYGNQMLFITYRTDQEKRTKADLFGYSPAIRRVRRFPQPQREDKMATWPMTFDDSLGRDAWEFSWRILGTDTLTETVRFPKTRPVITLATPEGVLYRRARPRPENNGRRLSALSAEWWRTDLRPGSSSKVGLAAGLLRQQGGVLARAALFLSASDGGLRAAG